MKPPNAGDRSQYAGARSNCMKHFSWLLATGYWLLAFNDLFHFLHQHVGKLLLIELLDDLAVFEQQPHALAAGYADVGLAGLAGPVHHAAHDRDGERFPDICKPLLNL